MFLFRQSYPDIEDPEYLRCCGYIHVRKLARYIASIFFILMALDILIVVNYGRYDVIDAVFAINVFIFILVVLAEKLQKPLFYLPSLGYLGFYIIIGIPSLFVYITVFLMPEPRGADSKKFNNEKLLSVFIIFVICAILEAICIYFWQVIYEAYRYMIKEVKSGNVAAAYASQEP